MFSADVLTFREFMMGEPLPLATLQQAILEFLRGRNDVVVFGAQAVNAYVNEPRMTAYAVSGQGGGCACFRRARLGTVTW